MANVITAILTDAGRAALAKSFGGPVGNFSHSFGKYFKIGTAMHTEVNGQDQPLPPDVTFTDIQSADGFWYRKSYQVADILFVAPATVQFRCYLDLWEANGDQSTEADTEIGIDGPKNSTALAGQTPVFYELGIFDEQNVMIAYGTFPGEGKVNTKTLNHLVNINF